MVDEERIKKANQILTNITLNTEFDFINERGRLVLRRDITPLSLAVFIIGGILFAFGIIIGLYILIILGLLAFGFVVFSEFINKNYIVIDYNNGNLYYDRRRNDSSISKKPICSFKDIIAVGVNNRQRHAMKGDNPVEIENGFVGQSAVALLKKDGTLIYLNSFEKFSSTYDNNCCLSDAISELFNIPKLNANQNKQIKIIKNGASYQLKEEPLVKGSQLAFFAKLFGIVIVVMILMFFLIGILIKYTD
ncbi:MAG: hypothetical protein II567_15870 [Candidatus Riflebacteria bacterium]|nr:hypothetical protein [Candidatus Riflebacteria bacterium]